MSLVHKIPPLVSALAFGYGVGMAAPDSTITPVKAAIAQHKPIMVDGPPLLAATVAPAKDAASAGRAPKAVEARDESRELARLRDVVEKDRDRGGSLAYDFDRGPGSRASSRGQHDAASDARDGFVDSFDADDLDSAGSEALSKLQLPDLKVSITRRTLKYVKFFTRTDRGRGMFETWLRRSGRYQETIQEELRERRLPEDLMWVAMIESGFDPRAKSPAGAVGLWQFMPATGEVYGLIENRSLDQRKNPRLATKAAAHHLRDLYMRFGSWDLALAAYNMGYEQLLDAIDRAGTTDFNELARQEALPEETAMYVPKIAAAAIVANNLEHFGFDRVELLQPVDAADLAVPAGTPLRTLAKACGVSTAQIRALNPDILGERVPQGRGDYLVQIPASEVARATASLPTLLENEPIVTDEAQALEAFDALAGRDIARRHMQREDDSLLSLLPSPRRHRMRDALLAARDDRDDRDELSASDRDDASIDADLDAPRPSLRAKSRRGRETVIYRATDGDTLASVARQFGLDIEDVAAMNHMDSGDKLKTGKLLKLKVRRDMIGGGDDAKPSEKHKKSAG